MKQSVKKLEWRGVFSVLVSRRVQSPRQILKLLTSYSFVSLFAFFFVSPCLKAQYNEYTFNPGFTVQGFYGSDFYGQAGNNAEASLNGIGNLTLSYPGATNTAITGIADGGLTVYGTYLNSAGNGQYTSTSFTYNTNTATYSAGITDPGATLTGTESATYFNFDIGKSGTEVVGEYGIDNGPGYSDTTGGFVYNSSNNSYTRIQNPLGTYGSYDTNVTGVTDGYVVGISPTLTNGGSSASYYSFLYDIGSNSYTQISDPLADYSYYQGTRVNGIEGNLVFGSYSNYSDTSEAFTYNLSTHTYTTVSGLTDIIGIENSGDIYGHAIVNNSQVSVLVPTTSVTPSSQPSTVSPGGSYSTGVTPLTAQGGHGTTVSVIGGTAPTGTSSQTVTLAFTGVTSNNLSSDEATVSGNNGTIFALQLTFDVTAASYLGGSSSQVLLWQNPTSLVWENAIDGDTGTNTTNSNFLDYKGSFASFITQYGTEYSFSATNLTNVLGAYGVDTSNNTVWAVINHNSTFGVGAVPEPSTWALMLGGLGLMIYWRARTRQVRSRQV